MAPQNYQLMMRNGPTPGKAYALAASEVVIGREVGNDIIISDPEVSRRHARLWAEGGNYLIEDFGSTNGTFVNGQRLMGPHLLQAGEMIQLGENVILVFEIIQFDPDATIAASNVSSMPADLSPAYQPGYASAPPSRPPTQPQPPYPPATPPQAYQYPEEEKSNLRPWIYVGCGCLLVVGCVLMAGLVAFDQFNLYCSPPFDLLSGLIWSCP